MNESFVYHCDVCGAIATSPYDLSGEDCVTWRDRCFNDEPECSGVMRRDEEVCP